MTALGSFAYVSRLDLARDLGLDQALEQASGLYDAGVVSAIFEAIALAYQGPIYVVLEVGSGDGAGRGRLHAHIVSHRQDVPQHIKRDTARCQRVYNAPGLFRYLAKEPEPWSLEAELDARAALVLSPSHRLPYTRRHYTGPQRLAWVASLCTNDQSPPTDPNSTPDLPIALEPSAVATPPSGGEVLPDSRKIEPVTDHPQQTHDRARAHIYQLTRAVEAVLRDRRHKRPLETPHEFVLWRLDRRKIDPQPPQNITSTPSPTPIRTLAIGARRAHSRSKPRAPPYAVDVRTDRPR